MFGGKKSSKEKMADFSAANNNPIAYNNMKSNFSTTANIFVRIFFLRLLDYYYYYYYETKIEKINYLEGAENIDFTH